MMMMMKMKMMMMMNCFYGIVDRRKALIFISSRNHCQNPHQCESLTRHKQDLNLRRIKFSLGWKRLYIIDISVLCAKYLSSKKKWPGATGCCGNRVSPLSLNRKKKLIWCSLDMICSNLWVHLHFNITRNFT